MLAFSKHRDLREFEDRLRDAPEATAELMSEILAGTLRRFPSAGQAGKAGQGGENSKRDACRRFSDASMRVLARLIPTALDTNPSS